MKMIYWGESKGIIKTYPKSNIPVVCIHCGTYWHQGQIQDHKNKCDQKG